jgi:hypothetical protein
MRSIFAVVLLAVVAVAAGCQVRPLSPTEVRSLADAERLWAARGFEDYTFEIRRSCFCPIEFNQWARVDVVGGRVTRVILLDSGAEMPPGHLSWFPTVEQVFESIRTSAAGDWVKDVAAEFDDALGFPSSVTVTSKPNVQDGTHAYYLRNARPITGAP